MSQFQPEGIVETALNPIQPVSDDFNTDGYLPESAKVDHQHPLSPSLRDAIFNSTVYVKKSGDTMTGPLSGTSISLSGSITAVNEVFNGQTQYPNGGNFMIIAQDAAYLSFYNAGFASRRGYIQGNSSPGILIVSESGVLGLNGVGGISMSNFTINGYAASTSAIANRIVLAQASGYIFGNYFNMTANIDGTATGPQYVACQVGGDNYLRWSVKAGGYKDYSATNWTDGAVISNGYTQAAVVVYAQGYDAPYMRFYGPFGRIDFTNSAGSYFTLGAAAYTVQSSAKTKENIEMLLDDPLLQEFFWIQSARYDRKDSHPLALRPFERWREVNEKWIKRGHKPLRLTGDEVESVLHDCDIEPCPGNRDYPCMAMRNHRPALGLIAEDVWERFPEVVSVDGNGEPEGLFVEMAATLAMGGVAALTREVVKLMIRVDELENA